MKAVRCSDDTYAMILQHAARRGINITRAVDELINGSSFEQNEGLSSLKRIDELELQTQALLGLLHSHILCDPNDVRGSRDFHCQRCGEGLMDYVEESRNPEGVCDWQAWQCLSCGWAFPLVTPSPRLRRDKP